MEGELTRKSFERAILAAMNSACARPVRWGWDDCGLWCANILEKVLGYDPGDTFRSFYGNRAEARAFLGRRGVRGAVQQAAKRFGWVKIDPATADPGDIGLALTRGADGKFATTCFICRSKGWFVARAERGIAVLSWKYMRVVWRVLP